MMNLNFLCLQVMGCGMLYPMRLACFWSLLFPPALFRVFGQHSLHCKPYIGTDSIYSNEFWSFETLQNVAFPFVYSLSFLLDLV